MGVCVRRAICLLGELFKMAFRYFWSCAEISNLLPALPIMEEVHAMSPVSMRSLAEAMQSLMLLTVT